MFRLVKGMRTDSREVEDGRCMRGNGGMLCFSEKERGNVWRDHEWKKGLDCNVEGDAVECPVVCVGREEVLQALNKMKTGREPGPSEVSLELFAASRGFGIHVVAVICQKVLDWFPMPAEWALSIVVPIFRGKGDTRNCSCNRTVKISAHGMKVVERVLEKRLCSMVSVDEMQFGFLPERGAIDPVFILRKMQEQYHAKGKKLYVCFVDLEKPFDKVPRKVLELAMRKKEIPEVLVRSVMSLYDWAKKRVRADFEL